MKIAIFHELHSGGARRSVNEFAKRLKKTHLVDLYYVDKQIQTDEQQAFTHSFFYPFIPKIWKGRDWKVKLYKDTIEFFTLYLLHKKIASDINSKNYDVVFIHPSQFTQAPFLLRFVKQKKIYYCQEPLRIVYDSALKKKNNLGLLKNCYESILRLLKKKIDKDNITHADIVLANSQFSQKSIDSAYGIKSQLCYLGVDTHFFSPDKTQKEYDALFIGAKDEIDGYDIFMHALSLLKKKITVKTHTPAEAWIEDERDFKKLYLKTRLVVCLARNEPFGLTPLEAMSCGVPVIASNEGGYKETVIDGKTGFLIKRDPKIVAEKINFLLSDQKVYSRMSNESRSYILKKWTWEKSAKKLEKFFYE